MQNYDVIIVGAGLGGLTSGAYLSKKGKKVLIVEQQSKPGGCATNFNRKGCIIEAGLHEIDGMDKGDIKHRIFNDLGVFDNINFIRVPEFYRLVTNNYNFVVPDDYRKAISSLSERFPEEKKGITKFFKRIISIRTQVNRMWMLPKWGLIAVLPIFPFVFPAILFNLNGTLGKFLDKCVRSESLKAIILGNMLYYQDDPYTISLVFYSVAQGSYLSGGGHYIKGGSQQLSNYLANIVLSNSGEIVYNHLVTKIITENNRAIGIEYCPKNNNNGEVIKASGKTIIANTAIPNVADMLIDSSSSNKLKKN